MLGLHLTLQGLSIPYSCTLLAINIRNTPLASPNKDTSLNLQQTPKMLVSVILYTNLQQTFKINASIKFS